MTVVKEHIITQGDTLTPLAVTLKRKNASGVYVVVDLNSSTVKFSMVDDDGNDVVTEASATIDDADEGDVYYDFQAADVDTAGTFWGWFIEYQGGETDTYPVDGRKLKITINAKEGRS